jgi:hypothetical protein
MPPTLTSVMMIDCVAGETNLGRRDEFAVAFCAGTVMVKRAEAATGEDDAVVAGGFAPLRAGTVCEAPPLEQLHKPHNVSSVRIRVRIVFLK